MKGTLNTPPTLSQRLDQHVTLYLAHSQVPRSPPYGQLLQRQEQE